MKLSTMSFRKSNLVVFHVFEHFNRKNAIVSLRGVEVIDVCSEDTDILQSITESCGLNVFLLRLGIRHC